MSGVHKINIKHLITSLAISLGIGVISAIITTSGMESFNKATKPPLTPPGFLFPVVWTILFILMGISAYIIYESDSKHKSPALTVYATQLAVNFMWPIFFFFMQKYLLSFIWIVLLWALIIIMITLFAQINKLSAWLQVPYLLWVTFASYLTFGVYLLN